MRPDGRLAKLVFEMEVVERHPKIIRSVMAHFLVIDVVRHFDQQKVEFLVWGEFLDPLAFGQSAPRWESKVKMKSGEIEEISFEVPDGRTATYYRRIED